MTCEDLEYFFVDGFDLLDQEGIRVLSKVEKAQAGGSMSGSAYGISLFQSRRIAEYIVYMMTSRSQATIL